MKNYTEEELAQNYEKFINFVKNGNEDRLNKLLHMYSFEELGEELMFAPASGKVRRIEVAHYKKYLDSKSA